MNADDRDPSSILSRSRPASASLIHLGILTDFDPQPESPGFAALGDGSYEGGGRRAGPVQSRCSGPRSGSSTRSRSRWGISLLLLDPQPPAFLGRLFDAQPQPPGHAFASPGVRLFDPNTDSGVEPSPFMTMSIELSDGQGLVPLVQTRAIDLHAVPEPATLLLLGLGLAKRHRRRVAQAPTLTVGIPGGRPAQQAWNPLD